MSFTCMVVWKLAQVLRLPKVASTLWQIFRYPIVCCTVVFLGSRIFPLWTFFKKKLPTKHCSVKITWSQRFKKPKNPNIQKPKILEPNDVCKCYQKISMIITWPLAWWTAGTMRNMPKGGKSLIPFSGEAGLEAEAEDNELEARLEDGLELRLKLWRKLLDRDRTKSPNSNMIELPVDIFLYHCWTLHF